ncbi:MULTISPECIES: HAMP domain-containing sensor histidine kinase [Stenotrophomonas]|uniref:histidine kinase n=1 Tax=Stenotrophomonas maltophilia TaxID=40324 RepID=A0A4V3RJU8_STEMA|nr:MULTISPECIES: HAMP domain-containing sensor histidine kinase [Stenotrophomonas]MBD3826221.1 HAMP domain-containing histidine kinase [Stenotrophomonas sp.]TGY37300.1 HAMP domain-containing histidine kinase [Stenotrophomonas maltophilia]HBS64278.1 sensor histidine kinase [Stenotrophomonas sp.]
MRWRSATRRPAPLHRRMVWWLLGYLALISLAVFSVGNYVHEHAEHSAWRALLNSELDSIVNHIEHEPHYRWQDSDTLRLFYINDASDAPESLRALHPGLHDGVMVGGRQSAVMVRETPHLGRLALVLDINDFHELEQFATRWVMLAGVVMIIVTVLMASFGVGRLVRPLSSLARRIDELRPGVPGQRVEVDPRGSSELYVIANALNDYLARNEQFVERERVFISTASHELRTPIAVITGAAELALGEPDVPDRARQQMQRVRRTAQGVEQLIQLLLVLARDPARLAALGERIALDQLVPDIIEDHRHLMGDKDLRIDLGGLARVDIVAPLGVVQAAIGNLLRNAIENSGRGTIRIEVSPQAVVTLQDPGHGMSPEEIAAVHARMARGYRNEQSGIGLELIARLCEHLGWALQIEPCEPRGTRVILDLGASLPDWPTS